MLGLVWSVKVDQRERDFHRKRNGIRALELNINKLINYFFISLFFYAISQAAFAQQEVSNKEITFGVLPIISTEKLFARFGPMADYLSKQIGQPVRLVTAPDFPTFKKRTESGKSYDIVFTAPHLYYIAQRKVGYKVIVRVAAPEMKAVIVVPKESKIRSLDDLKGKKLSTTAPVALSTLMIKAHLKKAGINTKKDLLLIHTPSHTASLISTYKGVTDAGSLMLPPFNRAKKVIKDSVRILSLTDGVPHMPIAVSKSLNKTTAEKIKIALVQLKSSSEGRALLKHLRWPGFAATEPREYDKLKWAVDELK